MRTPVQARSETSAEAMVEATLALLAEGGVAAVTVAAVARRAGTSNGSLYHRFGGRDGLLLAAQDAGLRAIETATAEAFAAADTEPDDERALALLSHAALAIFAAHRGTMRAFLVETRGRAAYDARSEATSHALAALVTDWLVRRFGATPDDAEAAYRLLFALGATQALVDDGQVSTGALPAQALTDALARAIGAVVRAPSEAARSPRPAGR